MAEKKTEPAAQAVQRKVEDVYDAAEIAQASPRLFGYSIDLATAALDVNGVKRATLAEAKRIIKEFAERKVN